MLEFDHYAGIIYYFIRPSKVIRLIRIPRTILVRTEKIIRIHYYIIIKNTYRS